MRHFWCVLHGFAEENILGIFWISSSKLGFLVPFSLLIGHCMLDLIIWELGGLIGEKSPKSPNQNRVGGGRCNPFRAAAAILHNNLVLCPCLSTFLCIPRPIIKDSFGCWLFSLVLDGWIRSQVCRKKDIERRKRKSTSRSIWLLFLLCCLSWDVWDSKSFWRVIAL